MTGRYSFWGIRKGKRVTSRREKDRLFHSKFVLLVESHRSVKQRQWLNSTGKKGTTTIHIKIYTLLAILIYITEVMKKSLQLDGIILYMSFGKIPLGCSKEQLQA